MLISINATDAAGNNNNSETTFFVGEDNINPFVLNLLPFSNTTLNYTFNVSQTIEIGSNVTDYVEVDFVYANITIPNGTIVQINLTNTTANNTAWYNENYVLPYVIGWYNVRVIANDTSNNWNETDTWCFDVENTAPTQDTPILNSTLGTNYTTENLTVYNISTFDVDNDSVKNIINWYRNGTSIAVLNMPFEGGSLSGNATGVPNGTSDYSSYGNHGNVTNAVWNSTGGYDGKGIGISTGL